MPLHTRNQVAAVYWQEQYSFLLFRGWSALSNGISGSHLHSFSRLFNDDIGYNIVPVHRFSHKLYYKKIFCLDTGFFKDNKPVQEIK